MEIIFQSGNFYGDESSFWLDFFIEVTGATLGGLIGVLGALFLFRRQVKRDEQKALSIEKDAVERKLHYFSVLIYKIIGSSKEQAMHLRDFCNSFKEDDPFFLPVAKLVSSLDVQRITERLNHEEYYHAYVYKYGLSTATVTEFRRFYSIMDFFNVSSPILDETYRKAVQNHNNLKQEYIDLLNESVHMARDFVKNYSDKEHFSELIHFLQERLSVTNQNAANNSSLLVAQEEWVDQVMGFLKNDYDYDETLYSLNKKLHRISNVFTYTERENERIIAKFAKEASKIEDAYKGLVEASDRLVSTYKLTSA